MPSSVQKGFNTDLELGGKKFHVQTEDWGAANPFLVTRVFCDGAVIGTVKSSRVQALYQGPAHSETAALHTAMRTQHERMLEQLRLDLSRRSIPSRDSAQPPPLNWKK